LFNYLGGSEPLALLAKLDKMAVGDFVLPEDIFDYFLTGQILTNDLQVQRTTVTALPHAIFIIKFSIINN
jgi:hypothetical protein